jgi:hypothetical protein
MTNLKKNYIGIFILLSILIPINLKAQTATNITYYILLDNFNVNGEKCGVEVSVSNLMKFEKLLNPLEYYLEINLSRENDINHKITIIGKKQKGILNSKPACSINQEIYINETIAVEWKKLKNKLSTNVNLIKCIDIGLKIFKENIVLNNEPIISNNELKENKLILKTSDTNATKIFQSCDKLLMMDLKKNLPCDLNNGQGKSYCDENFYSEKNNRGKLDFETALNATINGEEIKKGAWEHKDAEKNRLEKAESIKKAANEKSAELERRRLWLESPEGKKFLIDEEIKNKKREEERATKQAEAEKLRNEDKAKRAKSELLAIQADSNCTNLIKEKWEFDGTNNLGQRVVKKFSFIGSFGPYNGGGKYGKNSFWEFKLKLEDQNYNQKQFTVDCVFDANGKILGLSDPKSDY